VNTKGKEAKKNPTRTPKEHFPTTLKGLGTRTLKGRALRRKMSLSADVRRSQEGKL
jgi:hypothetical protein